MSKINGYAALSDADLQAVDAACEAFERALQTERPLRIEDCLAAVAEELRGPLFRELLASELDRQMPDADRNSGEFRDEQLAAYQARFPDRLGDIERVFQELPKAEATDDVRKAERVTVSVPGYDIEGVLGRGGMGVVYRALHLKLKRTVALKMILAGGHAGPGELARFRIEAEAVARLSHPNIVQIHEIGEADGRPYCAMEFVAGGSLADKLDGKPMPARAAAKLVEALARAMQLVHSRNVVHRDLKPANILLAADGAPKIADFGLARQLDADSGATQTGAVMGTPAYMAPEQASGHTREAGPAADIYALGAILYTCLTGQPPFKGNSVVETLDLVRTQEALAPSSQVPARRHSDVALDLDTICLKCLRKEPENRYASAAELADELVRFLNGEPILARPVGRVERGAKWVKRNPALAGAAAAVVLALAVGTTVSYLQYRETEAALGATADALKKEAKQRQAADDARDEAQKNERAERWGRYRSDIAAAAAALQMQNNGAARTALEDAPKEHRNWEWQYLHSQLDGARWVLPVPTKRLETLVLSPSGRQVAVSSAGHNEVYLYDVATGKLDAVLRGHSAPIAHVAYRPDGKQIASIGADEIIRVWDPATGGQLTLLQPEFAPPKRQYWARVTYNADGSRIASYILTNPLSAAQGATNRLWDATSGKEIAVLAKWQETAGRAVFRPDGKQVAASAGDTVSLFDATTGRRLSTLGPQASRVDLLAYSPDGRRIVSTSYGDIHLWDGETGKTVVEMRHGPRVTSVRFSPDGARLVAGTGHPASTAHLYDTITGKLLAVLAGHKNDINTVAFSADGKRVATASIDQTARLWDGTTGELLAVLRGHTGVVQHVVFSPNGTRLVTAADDATLRLWDAKSGDLIGALRGHRHAFPLERECPPVFTPDGSRLVSGSVDGEVRIWEIGQLERNILRGHDSFVYDVAFSPNGEQVASAAWDGTARLWDATTGKQTGLLKHTSAIITSVAYSRDGRRLATLAREDSLSLWNVASQKADRVVPERGSNGDAPRAVFDPAGTLLALASSGGSVRLLDAAAGQEMGRLQGHTSRSLDVAFHPDGSLLASTSFDGTVRLWDVASRTPIAVLRGHTGPVRRVAFSSDGKLLASSSDDKTIHLWDPRTHEKLAVISVGSIVYGFAFNPDGTRLAAGCSDSSVRLFDVARRDQVAELRGHADYVHAVAWSPDGTRLVSGSGDFTVRVWDALAPAGARPGSHQTVFEGFPSPLRRNTLASGAA